MYIYFRGSLEYTFGTSSFVKRKLLGHPFEYTVGKSYKQKTTTETIRNVSCHDGNHTNKATTETIRSFSLPRRKP